GYGDCLRTVMGQVDLDGEHGSEGVHLVLDLNRGLTHRRQPEDSTSSTRAAVDGRSVEGAVRALDEPGIGVGAIGVAEIDEIPEAAAVLVEFEEDPIAIRAPRVVCSIEGAVGTLHEAGIGVGTIGVVEVVKLQEFGAVLADLEDDAIA